MKKPKKKSIKKTAKKPIITKKITLSEVLEKYPEAAEIFMNEGLYCVGCGMANLETIEQGALAHGINVNKLVEKLNKKIQKKK